MVLLRRCMVAAVVGVAALTCSFPDDSSNQVYVVVYQSDSLLSRGVLGDGEEDFVFAKAFLTVGDNPDTGNVDDTELHNVEFAWASDDEDVLSVEDAGFGGASVRGESPGFASVQARVLNFDQAKEGLTAIRVSGLFAVDSVRPLNARYGDKLTFYGVRINLLFGASLGAGDLFGDFFSFQGNPNGTGQVEFWVPPPSSTGRPFFIGPGVFGQTTETVAVSEQDLFEPDSAQPPPIDISGGGGPRTVSGFPTLFHNPALFYEPGDTLTFQRVDWVRFDRADTTQAVTYVVNSAVFDDTAFFFLSDSLLECGPGSYCFSPADGGIIIAPGNYACGFQRIFPRQQRIPSSIVALKTLPSPRMHFLQFYSRPGRYELTTVLGYLTTDRRLAPDRFEENDLWCGYADENFARIPVILGGLTAPFTDTLTIDNPLEVDWIKFRVATAAPDTVTIRIAPRPFGSFDFSDIDLYVRRQSDFAFMGQAADTTSKEFLKLLLAPGDYLLGIVDAAGVPTRYGLCLVAGTLFGVARACLAPTTPLASPGTSGRSTPRRPRASVPLPAQLDSSRVRSPLLRP